MTSISVSGTRRANPEFSDAMKGWIATIEANMARLTEWERRVFNCALRAYGLDVDVTTQIPQALRDEEKRLRRSRRRDEAKEARLTEIDDRQDALGDTIEAVQSFHLGAPWVAIRLLATICEERAKKEDRCS